MGFVSGIARIQVSAKVLRKFEIGFLFGISFAISQFLICAAQFRNCINLQIAWNVYMSKTEVIADTDFDTIEDQVHLGELDVVDSHVDG